MYYIITAMEYYRCYRTYTPKKRAEIISDTIELPPKQFNMPKTSSIDATFNSAHDLINTLQNISPAIPPAKIGNGHNEALRTLAEISRKASPPEIPLRVTAREVVQEKAKEVNQ